MAYSLDRDKLKKDYDMRFPLLIALKEEAVHEIGLALDRSKLKFHSVTARVKTLESIANKAEDKQLNAPLDELSDVVGTRVVALFLSDIENITTLLKSTFDVHMTDNKIEDGDASKFGYLSVHLHARIKSSFSGTRYDLIKDIPFEIQIRTIAMDAWASASHYLDYKNEEDIPRDLKRDFHALSGLFYVADKHFEMFFRSRIKSVKKVQKSLTELKDALDQEINLDTVTAYLASKYPDRERAGPRGVSEIVKSLRNAGYVRLDMLDKELDKKKDFFENYERLHPATLRSSNPPVKGRFADIGVVRISLRDDPKFEPQRDKAPKLGQGLDQAKDKPS
jgi:ppGpp synthetase/RelA/SpoT-type nucleotidyltranferase